MSQNLEKIVLRNLINNEEFTRKVLPYIKTNYFEGNYKTVFKEVCKYVTKYNRLPSKDALEVEFEASDIPDQRYSEIMQILPDLYVPETVDQDWLFAKTEEWCQDRAIHLSILESINIIDGKSEKYTKNMIPELLTEALAVGFDADIGHDYFEDAESRLDFYHEDKNRIPFDLEALNEITKGGIVNKSLTIALAGTGVGKSRIMCHMAAANILMGYDVLYITAEMSEEKIAERIDANLLDIPIDDIEKIPRDMFRDKINGLKTKTTGRLIIKEYPTGQANASHFRALLKELNLKKQFKPAIVYIDYLNICASSRLRGVGGAVNSYSYIKAIAEEIRGLAVEFDLPIISATQMTRSGFSNSDPGLEDTSESFGLPATADLMFALITNEELERDSQVLVKQLKNRYNDMNKKKKFLLGLNKSHMRFFDVDAGQQKQIIQEHEEPPTADEFRKNSDRYNKVKELRV